MTEFTQITCGKCGIQFHVPEHWRAEKNNSLETFFCPNGHQRVYKESEADKFRRERDSALQEKARLQEENSNQLKQIQRMKKRSSAGVCPCCTRTFTNMARHIKTKHPELITDNVFKIKKA